MNTVAYQDLAMAVFFLMSFSVQFETALRMAQRQVFHRHADLEIKAASDELTKKITQWTKFRGFQ